MSGYDVNHYRISLLLSEFLFVVADNLLLVVTYVRVIRMCSVLFFQIIEDTLANISCLTVWITSSFYAANFCLFQFLNLCYLLLD